MKSKITACQTIAGIRPESGGTSRVVIDLADALVQETNVRPVIVTQSMKGDPKVTSANSAVQRLVVETTSRARFTLGLQFRRELKSLVEKSEIALIHNHGIWLPVNHWACEVARDYRLPLVVQPHGMLSDWALNYRGWKKQFALRTFQRHDLNSAAVIVATSEQEIENIRRLGLRPPVALLPNGVELPVIQTITEEVDVSKRPSLNVLFLGRIHPIKGLINLIDAWEMVRPTNSRLQIVGPDENGHLAQVKRRVEEFGLEDTVEFLGVAEGRAKTSLFEEADLFVLPSFSENFGVVVTEALAYGVPVITTHGAPWEGLQKNRCGWWVEPTTEALATALREAMSIDVSELQSMGVRGRKFAQEFDWLNIARKTADVYRWVLELGPKPDTVIEN